MTHVYKGFPQRTTAGGYLVTKDGQPLDPGPSQKLDNYGPYGFSWGANGPRSAQLALALLLDVTDDALLSVRLHLPFNDEMVATIPMDTPWVMLDLTIKSWVNQKQILERMGNRH